MSEAEKENKIAALNHHHEGRFKYLEEPKEFSPNLRKCYQEQKGDSSHSRSRKSRENSN